MQSRGRSRQLLSIMWGNQKDEVSADGDQAPDFQMPATGGRTVSLADYKAKPLILYFYPKADTPGCTKQACAFQEAMPKLGAIGLAVIGVSPDKIKLIERFAVKYGLTFPLASDEDHAVAERYGTWVEKSMYGRKYMGMERSTFLRSVRMGRSCSHGEKSV